MNALTRLICSAAGALAALAIVSIVAVVLTQVACRLLGVITQGLDEVVGWLTAVACVAGFGYAFVEGAHVRVAVLIENLPSKASFTCNVAALLAALGIATFASYASVRMVVVSYRFNELGQGVLAVPLWIPQLAIALGTSTLALAILDALVGELSGRGSSVTRPHTDVAVEI